MRTVFLAISIVSIAGMASAQEGHPAVHNVTQMTFAKFPGLPTCSPGSVQSGDPGKGPSIIAAKVDAGCTIPWHWHTPNEHLMLVSGVARLQTKDGKPMTLRAGGFAMMPAHHVHQFKCISACTMYVYSDAAFDIHYVDATGAELSPDAALKAVKEKTVKQ